ncbi:MAG: hypothetical protein SFV21_21640 [Rhodospirillaceae bacterium]|nr:hypothetical protein [Rhodospirillaceae bacterium]
MAANAHTASAATVMSPVQRLAVAFWHNFLGEAPGWYKATIVAFFVVNFAALPLIGPKLTAWLILAQFLFTLAFALKCYPLQPGGLIALQAIVLGLIGPEMVYEEVQKGLPVLLLMIFMVAAVYFLKDFLFFSVSYILLRVRNRVLLSFSLYSSMAFLSAFLDALTILAVLVTVFTGFYEVYYRTLASLGGQGEINLKDESRIPADRAAEMEAFRAFMRSMLMHSAVGAICGGVTTLVGQPENVIVGVAVGWDFATFFDRVAVLSLPAVAAGAVTCLFVERFRLFGYGAPMLPGIYAALEEHAGQLRKEMTVRHEATLIAQAAVCVCLILALAFHVAEVGLIGLAVIVFASAASGVTEEHRIGKAFEAGLPFTALLVVFFVIAGMIHNQHLFEPIIAWVLGLDGLTQLLWLYFTNGALSAISDNVFVATVYIDQIMNAFEQGLITRAELDDLAATVVIGTGIPAMATPNGQAAFLFLLTSSVAALVRLSYVRMMYMTLPYVVVCSVIVIFFLSYLIG